MKVTVIICTNAPERYLDIVGLIESLISQTYTNIEIIIIIDQIIELYNRFISDSFFSDNNKIIIGLSDYKGLSNARNTGVKFSSGDIIAFIDDDAIAKQDWVCNLLKNYSDPSIIGVGGMMKPLWVSGFARWIPEEFYWTIGCSYKSQCLSKCNVRSNFGSNMSFRREIFDVVGFFDPNYGLIDNNLRTGEETEFSIRALNRIIGSRIIFDPDCIVFHRIYQFRKSPIYILKRCYAYGVAIAKIEKYKIINDDSIKPVELTFINIY